MRKNKDVNGEWSIVNGVIEPDIHNSLLTIHEKMNRIVVAEECSEGVPSERRNQDEQRYIVDNIKKVNGRNSNTAINGRSQRIQHR